MTKLLEGKKIADRILEEVKYNCEKLKKKPTLVAINVGDFGPSKIYLKKKKEACEYVGMNFKLYSYKSSTTKKLLNLIEKLNKDESVDGIIFQLPTIKQIDVNKIIMKINPNKDVDGFNPLNKGLLEKNLTNLIPPTAKGILDLLDEYKIKVKGKNVTVIGMGDITGRPISKLLIHREASVIMLNKYSKNIPFFTKNSDIIISAVGRPRLINEKNIKKGSILINVGISKESGKIVGDIDMKKVDGIAKYVTPTPGGTGPLTVSELIRNTYICSQRGDK